MAGDRKQIRFVYRRSADLMTETTGILNYLWACCIIEELHRNGITDFCLSPGSRCTPLTTAIACHEDLESTIHFDERGTGFCALGLSRALNKPAVLVSTSGTAAANYLPAVVEAALDCIPLIILTADRPPELRQTGANQSIDQVKIFGDYVRWYFEIPCPTPEILPEMILTTIDQGVYRALGRSSGPIHLNCLFREPFLPDDVTQITSAKKFFLSSSLPKKLPINYCQGISEWQLTKKPYTQYAKSIPLIPETTVRRISTLIKEYSNGLVVVGRLHSDEERCAILGLIEKLNWPVYADITSGLRFGHAQATSIHYFDLLLHQPDFQEVFAPEIVIQFNGKITSKRWYSYLKTLNIKHYYLISNDHSRINPEHVQGHQLEVSISPFCQRLADQLIYPSEGQGLSTLKKLSGTINKILNTKINTESAIAEPAIARLISEHILRNTGLYLASSMPIRNMDLFAVANGHPIHLAANRGASGIDGTIASAVGFAKGLQQMTTVLTGDLALLHDLNSLALVKAETIPLIIVVINNKGGGIFSFLPVVNYPSIFEPYFGTPHTLRFKKAAEMFGLSYATPSDQKSFIQAYKNALSVRKSTLIEVSTDRHENVKFHHKIIREILAEIQSRKSRKG